MVVEAGARSGALSTANHGVEQGRAVAAVPGTVTSSASIGCHELIRNGATLVSCAAEIIELMQPLTMGNNTPSEAGESLFSGCAKPETLRVMDALGRRVFADPERIAQKAGLGIAATLSELGILQLDGKVECQDGRYRLTAA